MHYQKIDHTNNYEERWTELPKILSKANAQPESPLWKVLLKAKWPNRSCVRCTLRFSQTDTSELFFSRGKKRIRTKTIANMQKLLENKWIVYFCQDFPLTGKSVYDMICLVIWWIIFAFIPMKMLNFLLDYLSL